MKTEPYRENAREEVLSVKTERDAIRIWAGIFGLIIGAVTMHFYHLRLERQHEPPPPPPQCVDRVFNAADVFGSKSCDPDQALESANNGFSTMVCRCKGKGK